MGIELIREPTDDLKQLLCLLLTAVIFDATLWMILHVLAN